MSHNELVLTGEDIQKLIDTETGDGIIKILNKIDDPVSRLVTLTCLLASLVVAMTDDELTAIQTMTELSKLQLDVVTGLHANNVKEQTEIVKH